MAKIWQKIKKILVQFVSNPFFTLITQNPDFRNPVDHYMSPYNYVHILMSDKNAKCDLGNISHLVCVLR